MDTLVARYLPPHDDFFDDDGNDACTTQLATTKPSHDHKFSLPPIAQVCVPSHPFHYISHHEASIIITIAFTITTIITSPSDMD